MTLKKQDKLSYKEALRVMNDVCEKGEENVSAELLDLVLRDWRTLYLQRVSSRDLKKARNKC